MPLAVLVNILPHSLKKFYCSIFGTVILKAVRLPSKYFKSLTAQSKLTMYTSNACVQCICANWWLRKA